MRSVGGRNPPRLRLITVNERDEPFYTERERERERKREGKNVTEGGHVDCRQIDDAMRRKGDGRRNLKSERERSDVWKKFL